MTSTLEYLSILGIILTALFASVGYFYKNYLERKKIIKQVLFYYLDLRNALEKRYVSVDDIFKEYKKYLNEKNFSVSEEMVITLKNTMSLQLNCIKYPLDKDFIQKLKESIDELSKIDPVLAYELSNKDKIFEIIDTSNDVNKLVTDDIYEIIKKDIDSLILHIARKVNYLTYLNVKEIIEFNRIEASIEMMDNKLGKIFNILKP